MSLKLALQLYSVGADAKADFDGTLKRVSEMGYEGVEFAGLYGYDADHVVERQTELVIFSDLVVSVEILRGVFQKRREFIDCPLAVLDELFDLRHLIGFREPLVVRHRVR